MENVIVAIIVAVAAIYVGRRFYRSISKKESCDCVCTCCTISDSCSEAKGIEAVVEEKPKASDPGKSDP